MYKGKYSMAKEKIPIYCVPGLAADVSIFEFIKLDDSIFEIYTLPWKIPYKNEPLADFAKRMTLEVKHENPVLIGVSFGGILVQEMRAFLKCRKVIIISSVKSRNEMPLRLQLLRSSKLYKLIPTSLIGQVKRWEQLVYGDVAKKIAKAYQKYLTVTNKDYLDWAIENVLEWKQEEVSENIIHIHGEFDQVFPIKNIKDIVVVPKGNHAMILRRSKWFNENLPKLILQ